MRMRPRNVSFAPAIKLERNFAGGVNDDAIGQQASSIEASTYRARESGCERVGRIMIRRYESTRWRITPSVFALPSSLFELWRTGRATAGAPTGLTDLSRQTTGWQLDRCAIFAVGQHAVLLLRDIKHLVEEQIAEHKRCGEANQV
jgi:hypothetical protein